jgi:hypothetical protein
MVGPRGRGVKGLRSNRDLLAGRSVGRDHDSAGGHSRSGGAKNERWLEVVGPATGFVDGFDSPVDDYIAVDGATPSAPSFPIPYRAVTRYGDHPFIDILPNYPVP